jgi:aryl-phospho-beta-D-glucosidase BglC (GH1 family)
MVIVAHRYGLRVLLDLHTVPGGANGFDNGGVTSNLVWLGQVARHCPLRAQAHAHTQP